MECIGDSLCSLYRGVYLYQDLLGLSKGRVVLGKKRDSVFYGEFLGGAGIQRGTCYSFPLASLSDV